MAFDGDSLFRIAIVGGGIGGLYTALALHHRCSSQITIDVYEQAPEYREIGAGVGFGINATKLLGKIDLYDEVDAIAHLRDGVWLSFRRFDDGGEIVTVPGKEQGKIRPLSVQRAEFLDLLYQTVQTRKAARLHTNKACCNLRDLGTEVEITFRDGTHARADLIVAADGIHSNIRSHFVTDTPKYSGKVVYRCLCPIDKLAEWWPLPTYGIVWVARGKHIVAFPISRNKTLCIVAFTSEEKKKTVSGEQERESWILPGDKETVRKEFKDFDNTVQRILEYMDTDPAKWLLHDREPLKEWVFADGKVVLLGDAAHAMLPHQGAGAGQAIEDGYVLAQAVGDFLSDRASLTSKSRVEVAEHLQGWLRLYQSVRLPRAEKVQWTSRQSGNVLDLEDEKLQGRPYDECMPLVVQMLKDRMNWIWDEDVDVAYDRAKAAFQERSRSSADTIE